MFLLDSDVYFPEYSFVPMLQQLCLLHTEDTSFFFRKKQTIHNVSNITLCYVQVIEIIVGYMHNFFLRGRLLHEALLHSQLFCPACCIHTL